MITVAKWNTPEREYSERALEEARMVFGKCLADIERNKWNNIMMAKDYRGYRSTLRSGEYFSAMGLVLKNFIWAIQSNDADEVIEIVLAVIGSEANKMGYTSPRHVEQELLKKGVKDLFERCMNACLGIIVDNRTAQNIAYKVKEEAENHDINALKEREEHGEGTTDTGTAEGELAE